jgi:hypothetical protein
MTLSPMFGAPEPRRAWGFNFVGRVTERRMDCMEPEVSVGGSGIVAGQYRDVEEGWRHPGCDSLRAHGGDELS